MNAKQANVQQNPSLSTAETVGLIVIAALVACFAAVDPHLTWNLVAFVPRAIVTAWTFLWNTVNAGISDVIHLF